MAAARSFSRGSSITVNASNRRALPYPAPPLLSITNKYPRQQIPQKNNNKTDLFCSGLSRHLARAWRPIRQQRKRLIGYSHTGTLQVHHRNITGTLQETYILGSHHGCRIEWNGPTYLILICVFKYRQTAPFLREQWMVDASP